MQRYNSKFWYMTPDVTDKSMVNEEETVKDVYNAIAKEFDNSRYRPDYVLKIFR